LPRFGNVIALDFGASWLRPRTALACVAVKESPHERENRARFAVNKRGIESWGLGAVEGTLLAARLLACQT
jgi:hypothetical protein